MKNVIKTAVKNLCLNANIKYDAELYDRLFSLFEKTENQELKKKISYILKNIKLAAEIKRPMCQDTGIVIVFLKIGTELFYNEPINYNEIVDQAVKEAYTENYFRKSIVENALSNRTNTGNNAPAEVYIEFVDGDEIEIDLLVKGAGAENMSETKMFPPSAEKEDIFRFIKDVVRHAGEKACPPLVLGVGIGGSLDGAAVLSKRAFFDNNEPVFREEFIKFANDENILDVKILSGPSHIASLPVAVTVNCHCTRHSSCVIKGKDVQYKTFQSKYKDIDVSVDDEEILVSDIEKIRNLKSNQNILLTGEIYTARDAAHRRIAELLAEGKELPIELKDKIIFYAGPCPEAPGEISGPTGPTTAYRMDKYCELFYSKGLLATVGKGERAADAELSIKKFNGRYFTAIGGISCLLARCIRSSQIVAFEDLGTEAVRKLYVEKLPVCVKI